jgi:hypothetical protein
MREIEVKAKVADKQALVDSIVRHGIQLSVPIKQHDVVYGREGVADELWVELEKFGVRRSDEVFEGYDVLLNRKNARD